jgi:hypothetical protein
VIGWIALVGLIALGFFAYTSGSQLLINGVVVLIGCSTLLVAMSGKPDRSAGGPLEGLLHLLPEPAWRLTVALLGLAILTLGLYGLLTL